VLWNPSSRYTESALEPVEGFEREPLVRVAGVLTPVSRRRIVMDSVAELPPPPVPVDTASAKEPVDTLSTDSMLSDTASTLSDPASSSDTIRTPVEPDSTISDTTFTPTEPDSMLSDTTSVRPDTVSIR
jgi:hypothetical protein